MSMSVQSSAFWISIAQIESERSLSRRQNPFYVDGKNRTNKPVPKCDLSWIFVRSMSCFYVLFLDSATNSNIKSAKATVKTFRVEYLRANLTTPLCRLFYAPLHLGTLINRSYFVSHTSCTSFVAHFPAIIINMINRVLLSRLFALSTHTDSKNNAPAAKADSKLTVDKDFRWAWLAAFVLFCLCCATFAVRNSMPNAWQFPFQFA